MKKNNPMKDLIGMGVVSTLGSSTVKTIGDSKIPFGDVSQVAVAGGVLGYNLGKSKKYLK